VSELFMQYFIITIKNGLSADRQGGETFK